MTKVDKIIVVFCILFVTLVLALNQCMDEVEKDVDTPVRTESCDEFNCYWRDYGR